MVRVPVLSVQITDVAPPVSVPADKRLDGMLDACDLVLAFTKTSSHQEAVHILAGKSSSLKLMYIYDPLPRNPYSPEAVTRTGLPGKLQSHILEMYRLWRNEMYLPVNQCQYGWGRPLEWSRTV